VAGTRGAAVTIERGFRRVVLALSLAGAVVATSTLAGAAQGWYLLMPSDNQIMMDGSIAKGVTAAQFSQTAAFDTDADCETYRNHWGNKFNAARTLAWKQFEAAKDQRRTELQGPAAEAEIKFLRMRAAVCIASDDPRLRGTTGR
jgi:hypothetical protein